MPVRPKTTEYNEHFKWISSPKSATFHPSPQQAAPIAGLNSAMLGTSRQGGVASVATGTGLQAEPALQRRAKPVPLVTTSTTKMFDEDVVAPPQASQPPPDDFMLLGSQEKFANNVAYRDLAASKTRQRLTYATMAPSAERRAGGKPNFAATAHAAVPSRPSPSEPVAVGRPYDPPPKVVVDTGARSRTMKMDKAEPTTAANGYGQIKPGAKAASDQARADPVPETGSARPATAAAAVNSGRAQRVDTIAERVPADSGRRGDPRIGGGSSGDDRVEGQRRERDPEGLRPRAAAATESRGKRDNGDRDKSNGVSNNKSNNNSNGDSGDAGADEQASSTYAFKYKAGLAQPRPARKRKSEYQTKFDWKVGAAQTPVLAAEEVIHKSDALAKAIPRKAAPPKESEYNRQFKSWVPYYKPVPREDSARDGAAKLRRASSETSLVQEKQKQQQQQLSGSPAKRSPAGKRYTDTLNPQKPFFPHGRLVRWNSEYMANFRSFDQYKYESGAWIGAAPPHRLYSSHQKPATDGAASASSAPHPSSKSWLAEVIELRKRAEEYRKRALGTHFSREHVAQLLAEQSRLWDQESAGVGEQQGVAVDVPGSLDSSEASGSSRSKANAESGTENRPAAARAKRRSASEPRSAVGRSTTTGATALNDNRNNNAALDERSSDNSSSSSLTTRAQERLPRSGRGDEARPPATATTMSRQFADQIGHAKDGPPSDSTRSVISGSTRGSLSAESSTSTLSGEGRVPTPELRSSPTLRRHHLDITTPSKGGALLVKPQRAHRSPQRSHEDQSKPSTAPPPGIMPPAAQDSQQVRGPSHKLRSHTVPDAGLRQLATSPTYGKPTIDTHALLDEEASHDEILETRYVHSPHRRGARQQDEDAISVVSSICSTASSSLASEVLERARARRDQFWGRDGQVNRAMR